MDPRLEAAIRKAVVIGQAIWTVNMSFFGAFLLSDYFEDMPIFVSNFLRANPDISDYWLPQWLYLSSTLYIAYIMRLVYQYMTDDRPYSERTWAHVNISLPNTTFGKFLFYINAPLALLFYQLRIRGLLPSPVSRFINGYTFLKALLRLWLNWSFSLFVLIPLRAHIPRPHIPCFFSVARNDSLEEEEEEEDPSVAR